MKPELLQRAAQFAESMGDIQVPAGGSLVASGYTENDQGGERAAWLEIHLGRLTCSKFGKISLNRKGGGLGAGGETLLNELLGEWLTGLPASDFESSKATDWGLEKEPDAVAAYEKATRRKVVRGKFFTLPDEPLIGGTPDGVGRGWGLEIKCPYTCKMHVRTLRTGEVPSEYMDQVLGHLWLTGKEKVDFVSYDDRMKNPAHRLVIVTMHRKGQEAAIEELKTRVLMLNGLLKSALEKLGVDYKKKKKH